MKRKKIIRYILLFLLLFIAAAAIYIYKEFNRTNKDTATLKPDYSISATDLVRDFDGDEQSSNKKYWDKVLRVEGLVKGVEKDNKGFYTLTLGDSLSVLSVRCSIDSIHTNDAAGIKIGTTVAIKGICSGFNADELLGSDVILVRSAVDKEK